MSDVRKIGILNSKGGTAKTTSTVFLATAFARRGMATAVIDMDQQGSASEWSDRAEESGVPLEFPVEVSNFQRITRDADRLSEQGKLVIIDTPPGDAKVIDKVIATSDFIVIPAQPSPIEISRVWQTISTIGQTPYGVLIVAARLGTKNLEEVYQSFNEHHVSVFETRIPMREGIRDSFGLRPVKLNGYEDVAAEINEVF